MTEMQDNELSDVTGQALLQMDSVFQAGGSQSITSGSEDGSTRNYADMTFYKAGLDAMLEINLNIAKLQLGCGGVNGPGCDIDIDQLGLSGQCTVDRPGCAATLTRPYFEFAIKNDDTRTLREVVGIRLSAEDTQAMLTMGQNTSTPNGINVLSGYMVAATNTTGSAFNITPPSGETFSCPAGMVCGEAITAPANLGCGQSPGNCTGGIADPNATVLQFDVEPDIALCTNGCYAGNTATSDPNQSAGVYIPSMYVQFTGDASVTNGSRVTTAEVVANAPVDTVSLAGGQLFTNLQDDVTVASVAGLSNATVNTSGSVAGLNTKINFSQDLGLIHRINANSPFYLSFQRENVNWPGSATEDVAKPGWWMSFRDPVNLGELNPVQQIDITPAFGSIGTGGATGIPSGGAGMALAFQLHFNEQHYNAGCPLQAGCVGSLPFPVSLNDGIGALFGAPIPANVGNQYVPVDLLMDIFDMQLGSTQNVPRNCWGTANFC